MNSGLARHVNEYMSHDIALGYHEFTKTVGSNHMIGRYYTVVSHCRYLRHYSIRSNPSSFVRLLTLECTFYTVSWIDCCVGMISKKTE